MIINDISSQTSTKNNFTNGNNDQFLNDEKELVCLDWNSVPCTDLNFNHFKDETTKSGRRVSRQFAHKKSETLTDHFIASFESICMNDKEVMKLILHRALMNPRIVDVSKPVLQEIYTSKEWQNQGFSATEASNASPTVQFSTNGSNINAVTAKRFMENLRQIIKNIMEKKGKRTNDQERFLRIIFTAIAGSESKKELDAKEMSQMIGLSLKNTKRRLELG